MAFDPITHLDGTQYDVMIPDKVKVIPGPMTEIIFTNDEGDEFNAILYNRLLRKLANDLQQADAQYERNLGTRVRVAT